MDFTYKQVLLIADSLSDSYTKNFVQETMNLIITVELAMSLEEDRKPKTACKCLKAMCKNKHYTHGLVRKDIKEGSTASDIYSWLKAIKDRLHIILLSSVKQLPSASGKHYVFMNQSDKTICMSNKYAAKSKWRCIGKFTNSEDAMSETKKLMEDHQLTLIPQEEYIPNV